MGKVEKDSDSKDSEDQIKPECRHYFMLLVLFGIIFAFIMTSIIMNEWTQHVLREEYFPNRTEGFGGCGEKNLTTEEEAKFDTVQQLTARWQMYYSLAEYGPTFFVTLVLPSSTDTYGRKFLIVLSTAGMAARVVGITLAVYYKTSLWFIVGANVLAGLTGTMFSMFSACFSMVADLTHTENARTIGIVAADIFLLSGAVAAVYCTGLFVETLHLGFANALIIASATGIAMFLVSFAIKESLSPHKRRKRETVLKTIKQMTDFYLSSEFKGKRKAYLCLLLGFGAATVAGINRNNLETIYLLGKPFCWGPSQIGLFALARNSAQAFVGLGSLRILHACFSNITIGIISTLSNTLSYLIEGFAESTLMIYMVAVSGMLSFLVVPMIRSLMSSITAVDKQGAMFASVALIEVVCTLAANLTQNVIYTFTISFMNGFVFIICAVISIINMLLLFGFRSAQKEMDKRGGNVEVITVKVMDNDAN